MDFLIALVCIKVKNDSLSAHRLLRRGRRFSGPYILLIGKKYADTCITKLTFCSFSAALLGLPKLLKEDDIHAEYPSDTDDEFVTEKGYQPTLPGEYTKISSALALFRCSRILSKVLKQNYPAAATHDLSLQSLTTLETELNEWSDKLPTHLKLTFVQDKPSTDITGSRSALLVSQMIAGGCKFCSNLTTVSCVLLYSIFNPPTCCWFHTRQ